MCDVFPRSKCQSCTTISPQTRRRPDRQLGRYTYNVFVRYFVPQGPDFGNFSFHLFLFFFLVFSRGKRQGTAHAWNRKARGQYDAWHLPSGRTKHAIQASRGETKKPGGLHSAHLHCKYMGIANGTLRCCAGKVMTRCLECVEPDCLVLTSKVVGT